MVVVGQVARDLVLSVNEVPQAGGSSKVIERLEQLGGKGANQAVGLRQLGADVVLIGTLGADDTGQKMLDETIGSGIDTTYVARRGRTALLVDVVDAAGRRRLLEDVPSASLVIESDVRASAQAFVSADTVCLQLQQPLPALLAAARLAHECGARVVLDGAIDGTFSNELLSMADVVRADDSEAKILTGVRIEQVEDAARAAHLVLQHGPGVVAFAVPGQGDLVVWRGGSQFFPYGAEKPRDITGAGDAFLAGLIIGLRRGDDVASAGQLAAAAAATTVGRLGGRPDLTALAPAG